MTDIIEDLLAFRYATTGNIDLRGTIERCPTCGCDLEEGEDGEMHCPECDA